MADQVSGLHETTVPAPLSIEVPVLGKMRWSTFQWFTVNLPLAFIVAVWIYVLKVPWPRAMGLKAGVVTLVSMVASVVFATVLLNAIRKAYSGLETSLAVSAAQAGQLEALHEAGVAMTQDLEMDAVLGRVVDLSRKVLRARFAALQVADGGRAEAAGHSFLTSGMTVEEISKIGEFPRGRGVLKIVADARGSVRLDDLTQHPAAVGFPAHHPPMRTLLGTQVRFRDQILGYIYLTEKEDGEVFTEADEATLERFAAQAGAVIANARLYREVGRLAQAAERERIGRDLHDGTLQELYAIALHLEAALVDMEAAPQVEDAATLSADPAPYEAIADALAAIRRVMTDIRHYVFDEDLKAAPTPASLAEGLHTALHEEGRTGGPTVSMELKGLTGVTLSRERVSSLVQVVREAVSNARHHSGGSRITVFGWADETGVHLTIDDDGVGFDAAGKETAGHGLSNMQVRAAAMGGRLTLVSRTGDRDHGTRVRIDIPIAGTGTGPGPETASNEGSSAT